MVFLLTSPDLAGVEYDMAGPGPATFHPGGDFPEARNLLYSRQAMSDVNTADEVARIRKMLQAAIRFTGLSNREVERRMGFSNHSGYLSRLFHGSRELKLRQLLDILEAVGIPPANFFHAAYAHPLEEGDPARVQKALEHLFAAPGPDTSPRVD